MGYLGREWDQSVFGSWVRDTGGQTQVRGYQEIRLQPPLVTLDLPPNIRHDLLPAEQYGARAGKTLEHKIKYKQQSNSFGLCLRSKILNFQLARNIHPLFCMFQSESFYFDDFTSLCSCPVLWKYIPIFIFVSEFSPRVPTFLSLCLGFLMTLRCPGRGRECLVTREIASRNIWQYLNNNKASLGQPEHEVTFYPSPSLSGQDRLLSFNFRDCVRKERSQLLLSRR